jgi:LPXTG-site transpeptidase (sortase) family protein
MTFERWYRPTVRLLVGLLVVVAAWTLVTSAGSAWQANAGRGSQPTENAAVPAGGQPAGTAAATRLPPGLTPLPSRTPAAAATAQLQPTSATPTPEPTNVVIRPPAESPAPHLPDATEEAASAPPRLLLPTLDIDQEVVDVPITNNVWDLEDLGAQVGRLETTGAFPGDDLAMVLVGHVTLTAANKGPFYDLLRLRTGDEIIYRAAGRDYVFKMVTRRGALPEDVEQLYVADGQRLLLVTCSSWDFLEFEYARRLIVEAELIGYRQSPPADE